jgi:hypothetical protein
MYMVLSDVVVVWLSPSFVNDVAIWVQDTCYLGNSRRGGAAMAGVYKKAYGEARAIRNAMNPEDLAEYQAFTPRNYVGFVSVEPRVRGFTLTTAPTS